MGKFCKKLIDRKEALPHHALTHALDNGNRYATRSRSEAKCDASRHNLLPVTLSRLGLRDRTQAAIYARENDWL